MLAIRGVNCYNYYSVRSYAFKARQRRAGAGFIYYGGVFMAYKINQDCISCGSCAATCPVEAISEGDSMYVIDPDTCISCGACADTCPVGAIHEDE